VVVLDEAQMIPLESLEPILETMRLLVEHYRVTFVICTATQPVFEKPDNFPKFPGFAKGSIREIIKDVDGLYRNLERVKIELPKDDLPISDWKTLADELSQHDQALCIVSDRKSCRELHARAPKGAYHLSALMCAEHRSDVIKEIKGKLENRQKILVISTQLIEAGVDIDFPVVYRAMAGLDSIAQAAGRCNRRGKLNEDGKLGRVVVFNAMRKAPVGTLRKASETALNMIKRGLDNPMSRDVFSSYFAELYWKSNSLDANGVMKLLKPDASDLAIQFRSASEAFKIIDDSAQQTILVRYGKGGDLIEQLKASKNSSKGYETKLLRELQRYSINIYLTQFEALNRRGSLEEIIPGVFALNNKVEYDACVGLLIDEIPNDPKAFIVEKEMR
jgi:CRISPR-associated endonuclease/helicase Cas3